MKWIFRLIFLFLLAGTAACPLPCVAAASADPVSSRALQEALEANPGGFAPLSRTFGLEGSAYSGLASGVTPLAGADAFSNSRKLYAAMVDGKVNFVRSRREAFHPYLSAGVGMAATDQALASSMPAAPGNALMPMMRVGGGVNFHVNDAWGVSVDYKAGVASTSASSETQSVNFGVRYGF